MATFPPMPNRNMAHALHTPNLIDDAYRLQSAVREMSDILQAAHEDSWPIIEIVNNLKGRMNTVLAELSVGGKPMNSPKYDPRLDEILDRT